MPPEKLTAPIITIGVPTYNRSDYLDRILKKISSQIILSGRNDLIEVIVCDNNSSDETQAIAEKYEGIIRYFRNDENIGPDANFLKLFNEASGHYVWLPGDDDAVRDDTLSYILRMIDTYDFDFLYLRSQGDLRQGWQQRGASEINNSELLTKVNVYTTFITSQVIKSELIKTNLDRAKVHLGGFMAYYWIFLEALHKSRLCLISEEKEVFPNPKENTGGYRFYKVWAESIFDVIKASSFGRSDDIFRIMKSRIFFSLLLPVTFRLRSGNSGFNFESENAAASVSRYFGGWLYRPIILVYLNLPYNLLKSVNILMRIALRITRVASNNIV